MLQNNNILNPDVAYELSYNGTLATGSFDASQNWWGTTDEQAIETRIYDGSDDLTLGRVQFRPIATAPFAGTEPRVFITSPTNGYIAPIGTTSLPVSVSLLNHSGTWHWKLNEPFPASGAAGGNAVNSGATATITGLENGGVYTLYVALADANHTLLNPSVTASVIFGVTGTPTIAVTSPSPNQVFPVGTTSVPLTVNIANHSSGWHWRLNSPFPTSGYVGGDAVSSGNSATIPGLQDGHTYTANVVLVDGSHNLLNPSVGASVAFSVAGASVPPPLEKYDYQFTAGLSIFSPTLRAQTLRFEQETIPVGDGLKAQHLIHLGATLVLRLRNNQFEAAIGRNGVLLFGNDFPVDAGTGVVVNFLEPVAFALEGTTLGEPIPAAPTPTVGIGWAFAVAGTVSDVPLLPDGAELRVTNTRTGESRLVSIGEGGRFLAAFVDTGRNAVVSEGDNLRLELVGRDGRRMGRGVVRQIGTEDAAQAYSLASLSARPARARLLPNYPNPFNPETWIPFELRESAEVSVSVFDLRGNPVRRLELGHLEAGYYLSRERAAYWNGRNEAGERVASGCYWLEFRAGSHREMRRFVVEK